MGCIVKSGYYQIPLVGMVHINIKANSRSVRARWRGGMIYASVPANIDYDNLCGILRSMMPKLDRVKPDGLYHIGQSLATPELTVNIVAQRAAPDKIMLRGKMPAYEIMVGSNRDMQSHDTMVTISKILDRIGQSVAPSILLPQARLVAERIGRQPLMWTISNGHRTLGHCDAQGVIALSHALVFYPPELREYVICHELAHMTELNHSTHFHEICNAYCNGREKELQARLRAFKAPFVK